MRISLFSLLVFSSLLGSSQFYRGFGVMGGLTRGNEKWLIDHVDSTGENLEVEKIKHRYLWGFNVELFLEFGNSDVVRWRTEFEYDKKGTKDRNTKDKNKMGYLSWNNFLLFRGEVYAGYPYFLIGPRVEYTLSQSTPTIPHSFKPLHFSWDAGVGFEFITYGSIKPLVELHYNPDIDHAMYKKIDAGGVKDWKVRNRAWELRVGIAIRIHNTSCPPVFK